MRNEGVDERLETSRNCDMYFLLHYQLVIPTMLSQNVGELRLYSFVGSLQAPLPFCSNPTFLTWWVSVHCRYPIRFQGRFPIPHTEDLWPEQYHRIWWDGEWCFPPYVSIPLSYLQVETHTLSEGPWPRLHVFRSLAGFSPWMPSEKRCKLDRKAWALPVHEDIRNMVRNVESGNHKRTLPHDQISVCARACRSASLALREECLFRAASIVAWVSRQSLSWDYNTCTAYVSVTRSYHNRREPCVDFLYWL